MSLWLAAVLALTAALVLLFVLAARHERREAVERCRVQLEAMADIRSAAIDRWILERFGDSRVIAGSPAVAALAAPPSLAPPGHPTVETARIQLEDTLGLVVRTYGYLSAVVLEPDGRILVGAGEGFELDRACLDLANRCRTARLPVADFHLHRGATLIVQFAAPVFTDRAAAPVAVVLLTSDPESWLYPFLRHEPIPSDSGETVLVRRDGDDALYLSPLRHRADLPLTLRRPLSTPGLPAMAALQERHAFSEYIDYNGERVFAVTRSLPDTPWAMVVKVERAEILRDYRRRLAGTVAVLTGFILALAGLTYGAWHRQRSLARLALARSEARVASLLDQGSDAVLFISQGGVIAEANARACELFGHSHSEMVGMNAAGLETHGVDEGVARRLAEITGSRTAVFDSSNVRKDGTEFSGEVSARIVEEAGQTWTVAVIRDVTKRRRAEEALRESEAVTHSIMDSLAGTLAVVAPTGEIVQVNRAWREFAASNGGSPATIAGVGQNYFEVTRRAFPEEIARRIMAGMLDVLEGRERFFTLEYPCNSPDVERWFGVAVTPLRPDRRGLVTTHTDITARKRMEESLRQAGERLELALEGAGLGAYEGNIVTGRSVADRRFLEMIGYQPGEIDLTFDGFEALIHPDDRPGALAAYKAHLAGETPMLVVEYRMRHRDGRWVWVMDKGRVAARDPSGRPLRLLGVHLDITERKLGEIEREELVASVRGLSGYLSTIGEELRARIARELHDRIGQNLAALALDLEIVRSRLPAEALGATEARLDDAGRIVGQMVHDVRNLMGELRPPMLDEIGLVAALRWYGQEFALRSGVAFQAEGGDSVPRLAPGTETAVFRIAQEALTNVAMHAHARTASARFCLTKDTLVLVIEDDGGGFDTQKQAGSGVQPSWGLLGMRERAAAVGGAVRVESSVGAGTRVTIEVPR